MYHVYSHNDLDGVGCGIIAKMAFGDQVEVRYNSISGLNYQVERFIENGNKDISLFITDLSVHEENEERIDAFVKEGGTVRLIDHHKSALHLNDRDWGMVQVEYEDGRLTSATSLFYEYVIEHHGLERTDALDTFVELVREYDTWEWERNENETAKQLNDLFFLTSIDEFEASMLERLRIGEPFSFNEFETKLLEMEKNKIERYIRKKKREIVQVRIGDYYAGVVHAESYHSELGSELGKEYRHLDYIAIINMGGKRIGFRTIHDHADVSEVAGSFGGGGHAKASGCTLTEEAYKVYISDTFHLRPLRADAKNNTYNTKESSYGTLYHSANREEVYIMPLAEQTWSIEKNGNKLEERFSSFDEAERFIKREFACVLVRDELFVESLMKHKMQSKKGVE